MTVQSFIVMPPMPTNLSNNYIIQRSIADTFIVAIDRETVCRDVIVYYPFSGACLKYTSHF